MFRCLLFILLFANFAFSQVIILVDGNDIDDITVESSGTLNFGVYLEENHNCFKHSMLISLDSGQNGQIDASGLTKDIVFDIPTRVTSYDQGQEISISGTNFMSTAKAGPGLLANNLLYNFSNAVGDVTLTLYGVVGECIFDGSELTGVDELYVLDTLTIHHPATTTPDADAFTLNCIVAGRYLDGGTIDCPDYVYAGEDVTVTAIPADGYRVAKWLGTNSRYPLNEQTVTVRRNNQPVKVVFEPVPDARVTAATFRAGRTRESSTDLFVSSGYLAAGANEVPQTDGTLQIRILSDDDDELFSTGLVSYDTPGLRVVWPRAIIYSNKTVADGNLNVFSYSIASGRFSMKALGQDLTGWYSPLTLEVTIGDYVETMLMTDANDNIPGQSDVINGRGFMPGQFMIGQADVVSLDTGVKKYNARTGLTSGYVKGRVATTGDAAEVKTFTVTINDWTSEPMSLTKSRRGNSYSYRRPRTAIASEEYVTGAIFNFDKAIYVVKFSNADLGEVEELDCTVEFSWQ